jgi:hypothetical protein
MALVFPASASGWCHSHANELEGSISAFPFCCSRQCSGWEGHRSMRPSEWEAPLPLQAVPELFPLAPTSHLANFLAEICICHVYSDRHYCHRVPSLCDENCHGESWLRFSAQESTHLPGDRRTLMPWCLSWQQAAGGKIVYTPRLDRLSPPTLGFWAVCILHTRSLDLVKGMSRHSQVLTVASVLAFSPEAAPKASVPCCRCPKMLVSSRRS